MTETRANRILVVQGRLDVDVIQREQENMRNLAHKSGKHLDFENALSDHATTQLDKPDNILDKYGASIFMGSPNFNLDESTPLRERYVNRVMPLAQKILHEGEHALGICMGHQVFSSASGVSVRRISEREEIGTVRLHLNKNGQQDPILNGLPASFKVIAGHNNSVEHTPPGFTQIGETQRDPNSALRKDNVVTFQLHPEIDEAKELKLRVEASKGTPHEYSETHPFVDPHPATKRIFENFFNQVKKSR